jgi:ATP-dependent DNA helicase RecQ
MGIDKPDIRLVIHADLPKTLEGYYQETGRAGRDGLGSECVLLYSRGDQRKHLFFIDQIQDEKERALAKQKLDTMAAYCESLTCRRAYVMHYFGENWKKDTCDNCDRCVTPRESFDATEIAQKILSAIMRTGERYGITYVIDILKGSRTAVALERKHETLSVFGIVGNEYHKDDLRNIAQQLLAKGLIEKTQDEYPIVRITATGTAWLSARENISLIRPDIEKISSKQIDVCATTHDSELFELLRELRKDLASEKNVPPFVIFGDRTLIEMATYFPQSLESLSNIFGVGAQKLKIFGPKFLAILQEYAREQKLNEQPIPQRLSK